MWLLQFCCPCSWVLTGFCICRILHFLSFSTVTFVHQRMLVIEDDFSCDTVLFSRVRCVTLDLR